MTARFRISETDMCPKCGKWNPSPVPFYEVSLFGSERMRVSCDCGYSVSHHCLDAPNSLIAFNLFRSHP